MPKLYACIISPDIKRDRNILVDVADRFASVIEVIEDGILFDVSGLERLVGKPDRISQKILRELKRKNVVGRVAVADTVDTARLLARCTSPRISKGETSNASQSPFLSVGLAQPDMFDQLPLSGLNIERDTLNVFNELGLHTIKDLSAVPHDELIDRYGHSFRDVIDVLEQRGRSLVTPNVKENKVSWSFELNNPVEDFEQLIFLLNHGLERLFAEIKYAGFCTEHIDLSLRLRNKISKSYEIKTSFPTLDRTFWLKLINLRTALDPPEEYITAVNAVAYFTKSRTDQRGLYAVSRPEPESLLLTVGKLKKLVGEENVGVPVLLNQHLIKPFTLDADAMPDVTAGNVDSSGITKKSIPRLERSPRPSASRIGTLAGEDTRVPGSTSHLSLVKTEQEIFFAKPAVIGFNHFSPPFAAEVLVRDGKLVYVRTRLFAGHVTKFSGVWKKNSHWWARPWKTQEWDIEIENGGVYRLCQANGEWFLTGEYD